MRPLVERPQTKNEMVKYQKFFTRKAWLNVEMASRAALPTGAGTSTQSAGAPNGAAPILAGRSGNSTLISGTIASAAIPTVRETLLQP